MSQDKKVAFITKARIVASDDIWPTQYSLWGFFMLEGTIVVDCSGRSDGKKFVPGDEVRSTKLIRIDPVTNEFETMNTIYKVIPEYQVDAYRMTNPS